MNIEEARITFKMILGLSGDSSRSPCASLFTKLQQLKTFETQGEILTFLARSCMVHSMNSEFGFATTGESWQNEISTRRKRILGLSPEELEKVGNDVAQWNCSESNCWEKFVNLMELKEDETEKKDLQLLEFSKEDAKQYEEYTQEIHSLKMRSLVHSYMEQHNYGLVTKLFKTASKIYLAPPKIAFRKFYESSQQILQKQVSETEMLNQVERDCFSLLDSEEWLEIDRTTNRFVCDTCIGSVMCSRQIQNCFDKKSNLEFNHCLLTDKAYVECIEKSYEKIDTYLEK